VFRVPFRVGIDEECAVKALVDVALERGGVAVVQMTAERLGVELVGEAPPGIMTPRPIPDTPSTWAL
jgi:hypothetical protein